MDTLTVTLTYSGVFIKEPGDDRYSRAVHAVLVCNGQTIDEEYFEDIIDRSQVGEAPPAVHTVAVVDPDNPTEQEAQDLAATGIERDGDRWSLVKGMTNRA